MAARRHANSDDPTGPFAPGDVDYDEAEEWHVDFGHTDVSQMSLEQIVEAWHAGRLLDSTLVWREGMEDWEEALAVPELARALAATLALPTRAPATPVARPASAVFPSSSSSRVVADVAVSSSLPPLPNPRAVEIRVGSSLPPVPSPRPPEVKVGSSLPPVPNPRPREVKVGSSLPPVPSPRPREVVVSTPLPAAPGARTAIRSREQSSPSPQPPIAAVERTVDLPYRSRSSFANETPDVPTVRVPPVMPYAAKERSRSGLPARPNPASVMPQHAGVPLSVVQVSSTAQIPSAPRSGAWAWWVISISGVAVVLLLLITLRHRIFGSSSGYEEEEKTAGGEEAPVPSTVTEKEIVRPPDPTPVAPVLNSPTPAASNPVVATAPAGVAVQPSATVEPSAPPSAIAQAPANTAAIVTASTPSSPPPTPVKVPPVPEKHGVQSVAAPVAKPEVASAPKEKPTVPSARATSTNKAPPAASAAPVEVEKKPGAGGTAPEPTASAPAVTAPFDKDAAVATLNAAASAASRCPRDATGPGTVRVIFAPEGTVRSVSIVSGDFEATAAGTCVTQAFQRCKVPPFSGKPAAVSKQFVIPAAAH